jgi:ABC-type multidrug transport system fused ATPase/permease subunit
MPAIAAIVALLSDARARLARNFFPSNAPLKAGSEDFEPRYKPIDLAMARRLAGWLWPYRWRYVTGVALGTVMIGLQMLGPQFTMHLVDYTSGFLAGSVKATPRQAIVHVIWIHLLWGTLIGMSLALERARILVMTYAGEKVQFDIRRRLFEHLQRLSMSYYDKNKLGRIISRCTSDVGSLREVNVWGIDAIVLNVLMIIVAATFLMLRTDWRLFVAAAWLAPVIYVTNRLFLRRIGAGWQVVREGFTRVSTNLAENISGVRVVTAFNRQDPNLDQFNRLQVANTENNVAISRLNGVYQPSLALLGFLGRVIILSYGGYLLVSGRLTSVGAVVAAYLYWDWLMLPILQLGNWYNQFMMAMAGGERVFNLLDTRPDVMDVPEARPLPRIAGCVTFENVTFGYNPERPVLHGISFESQAGQTVALVGHTGSGKSSIISLIARFYQPQQGRILVDGHDIRHVTGDSLHRQMGLVLQVNYLFTGTVMDNIRYARPDASEEQVIAAARELDTYEAIMGLKDGFATEVGERGANMSLGQRQLICFTRAYLADPRIFMLDEATSAVDTATELQVQRALERLLAGRTTFIVAHRLSTIMKADTILVLEDGRIIERGTHRELLEAEGKYDELYRQFTASARQTLAEPRVSANGPVTAP